MNKSILITGVAGSGKSVICEELKKLGHKAYSIEDMKGLFSIVDKTTGKTSKDHDNNDLESVKNGKWICNEKKLKQIMNKNTKGIVFYCGTASNLDDLLPLFNKIFLLKVNREVLRERLSTRTSHDFGKSPEVQRWIFSWKKWWEDHIREKGAIVIDANRGLRDIAKDIVDRIK